MDVRVEGQVVDAPEQGDVAAVLQKALSGKKFKSVVAARVTAEGTETLCDLSATVPAQCTDITPVYADSPEGLSMIRHSTAHVMAAAVKKLYPSAKVTIGPAVENGFYYDFDVEKPFSSEDFPAIEAEMQRIVNERLPFVRTTMSKADAIEKFSKMGENFKVEIIEGIEGDTVSLYTCGDFTDLCRGPHVPSTGKLKVFKLMKVAGAYWRGDSKNEMLQRIYGTAWAKKEDQDAYLTMLEEAEKRDHRRLGKELDLFHLQEEAPGLIFWHAKGWALWQVVEQFMRGIYRVNGYQEVKAPQLLDRSLWERSGHWAKYRTNMFTTESENRYYALKPMNCPGHIQLFNSALRSYRDLPLRYGEFGQCHRNEPSGALHGLMRVRGFTQDDGHIFCTEDQILKECVDFTRIVRDVYHTFGFEDILYKVATRPEMRIGEDAVWDKAEAALIASLDACGLPYEILPGEGAFYGPKIEYHLKDCLGRTWQCGTVQVDFQMPGRLGAEYVAEDNSRKVPVMLHRAILGSLERWIGMLIEHYAGAMPVWLSPVQVAVASITDAQSEAAADAARKMREAGLRVTEDLRSQKINYKIRELTMQKLPYIAVIGEKEAHAGTVSVRARGGRNLGVMTIEDFIARVAGEDASRKNTDE